MPKANGLHHLAITTADIKRQIEYFSDVLGMELVALYWMHGVQGAWHAFLKLNDRASIAFVQTPEVCKIDATIGVTHSGNPGAPCAAGTMQHLALNVDSEADLLALRDRIRSRAINVIGPIDHGFCKSIYFAGLEHLSLEIATSDAAIDARAWIDPEVVALAGISPDELERYCSPPATDSRGGRIAQPPYDPAKPHMAWPPEQYHHLLSLSDDELTRMMSQPEPPVKLAAA
ncbi:MAG TPA: VOC family protein [Candidatus Binatia bacterium]|nr:VOC family protein [Candidatus Binatia bacterium]